MEKALVFDMDGTIANFYSVATWLEDLHNSNTRPYEIAEPLYDMDTLNAILEMFKEIGYKIIVTSWLADNSTKDFKDRTRKAKKDWLSKYSFPYDEIHLVAYGTKKSICTKGKADYQILIDDNASVRDSWDLGATIDATQNILEILTDLLMKELGV